MGTKRLILALATFAALPVAAFAEDDEAGHLPCAAREQVTTRLANTYGEYFAGGGLRDAQSLFEVWVSNDGDATWTILMTSPDGTTCVMASGTNWRKGRPEETPAGIPG